jgi:hypothetical protein
MSNDIRDIIERLAILEGRITPTTVKHGLNPQQKTVPQLPALFKPKHISVLTNKTDPEHPMHDYMVGDSVENDEEAVVDEEVLEEAKVDEEKLLDKVRDSLKDYLASVEKKYLDDSISKKAQDKDLGKKDKKDRDLVAKEKELDEDPTEEDPVIQSPTAPEENPTYAESACVKSVMLENGTMFEIHGDEHTGFEIRHGNNRLKTKFKNIDEATMAIEMFRARQRKNDESQDYVEEK